MRTTHLIAIVAVMLIGWAFYADWDDPKDYGKEIFYAELQCVQTESYIWYTSDKHGLHAHHGTRCTRHECFDVKRTIRKWLDDVDTLKQTDRAKCQ